LRIPLNATERATRKGDFPYWGANNIVDYIDDYTIDEPVVLIGEDGAPFLETGRNVAFSVNGPIWPNNHIHVMRPLEGHSPDYIAYALNTVDYSLYVTGSTRLKLTRSSLDRIRIPYYDLPTQRRIADYLDRETAQIDAMAEALDGLVARLEERRVAAIENATHALSESSDGIPHGWVFIPFKWAVEAHFPGDWGGDLGTNDTDRLCVRVADFDRTSGTVGGDVPTLRSYTTRSANERHLRTHDLLLEKSGGTPKNPVGRVVLYTGRPGRMTTNFVQCIRLNAYHESRFWHYVFLAAYKTRFTNVHVRQTTGIQNLDIGGFFDEKFACPPLDEQRRIADYLDAETAKIDAMIAKAGELRALLDERRSALITATVTGQHPVPEEH